MNRYLEIMTRLIYGKDFKIMITVLLFLILLPSFFSDQKNQLLIFNLVLTLFFIIGTNCLILGGSNIFKLSVFISIFAITLTWFAYLRDMSMIFSLLLQISYFFFFSTQLIHVLKVLFNAKKVTLNMIFGAFNGYILLGFIGSCLMLSINGVS